ncbi:Serine proteinase inhibitor 2 [Thelohanellus kitauei]|uniref:Serine proteinase inhibitor 2 n=1 Tax=Thelohanellus kitauei TaxID=669202 RepID=A0A0C2MDE6_THEKT|nr:Serine proteinase inhibitor 2 [Thelohanellus kitauei]
MMGAISIGLRGRSYEKMSKFLHKELDQFIDNEAWVKSESAKWWSKLRRKSVIEKSSETLIIYPGQLSAHYERISRQIFRRLDTKMDPSNADESVYEINWWIRRLVISGNIWKVVKKSMVSENKILFISTVYFQLPWKSEFYKYGENQLFWGDNEEFSKVEMICQLDEVRVYIQPKDNFKVIFKRAFTGVLSLVIVVRDYAYSTDEMLNSFKVEQLPTYLDQSQKDFVKFVLPKLKIPVSYDFVPALNKLGLTDIFYRSDTDFGRMTNHSVMMENLIQVSSVSVDLFGINSYTGGDAATSAESGVDELRVDRTFLFLLYSITENLVHFSALVNKPTVG